MVFSSMRMQPPSEALLGASEQILEVPGSLVVAPASQQGVQQGHRSSSAEVQVSRELLWLSLEALQRLRSKHSESPAQQFDVPEKLPQGLPEL